ncbi:MAG: hypothetical protein ACP5TY_03035, partial [Thermodesulforhabdaceae bacterium]
RHCEPAEGRRGNLFEEEEQPRDCFVASLLAMTPLLCHYKPAEGRRGNLLLEISIKSWQHIKV